MGLLILDWFGFETLHDSARSRSHRNQSRCPFIDSDCTKFFRDGTKSGVCTVSLIGDTAPVVICPNRLYAEDYKVLRDVAGMAFGNGHTIIPPHRYRVVDHDGSYVVAFGKNFGRELRLPGRQVNKSYFVDWILAKIDARGGLAEFVAVEIQSLDTTGSYGEQVRRMRQGLPVEPARKAGLNWENVNKRILPQLIYKGHVLRREALCQKGIFFVTPEAVHDRIRARLGGQLLEYTLQPGAITFLWYGLDPPNPDGVRPLRNLGHFSTTVDQVALAFTSPSNLPPAGVYESAIKDVLEEL